MMATLYDVSVSAINQHLKRIFEDNELVEESVIKKYLITASDGKSYSTKHYNLQAIIAVGFKVNNDRAVRFRKWAGQIVKDYTIQGWTMDKERLKKGHMSPMNILNVSWKIFVRYVCLSENFIRRLQISMKPLIQRRAITNLQSIFIENTLRFFLHRNENCCDWIIQQYDDMRSEYLKSMLCLVLGFRGDVAVVPFLMKEVERFERWYPDESYGRSRCWRYMS